MNSRVVSRASSRVNSARGDPKTAGAASETSTPAQQRMGVAVSASAARRSAALGNLSARWGGIAQLSLLLIDITRVSPSNLFFFFFCSPFTDGVII